MENLVYDRGRPVGIEANGRTIWFTGCPQGGMKMDRSKPHPEQVVPPQGPNSIVGGDTDPHLEDM